MKARRGMRAWGALLAGLFIWLAHFAIVYALPSLAAIGAAPVRVLVWIHGLTTMGCLALAATLAVTAWRSLSPASPEQAFEARLGMLGAALAAVAIVWQAAPAWVELAAKGGL